MRTLIIDKVDLRKKFERMVGDYGFMKELIQSQGGYFALLALGADSIDADDASVFLLNSTEEHLEVVINRQLDRQEFVGFKQPLNSGIVSMVVWNEHGISLSDVSEHEMFDDTADKTYAYKTESMMAVPLLLRGRVFGVLSAVNKRGASAFTDDDMNRMATVAAAMGHTLRSQILDMLVLI